MRLPDPCFSISKSCLCIFLLGKDGDGRGRYSDSEVNCNICDPASQNHQKVARHGFLVKGRF